MSQENEKLAAWMEEWMAGPLSRLAIELVDVEYRIEEGQWVLRLLVDKPGGVNLDDCAAVNREADAILEEKNPVEHHFVLEVSSPGLFRKLTKPKHFTQCLGRRAKIKLKHGALPQETRRVMTGLIVKAGETSLTLETPEGALEIPFEAVKAASLNPELGSF